MPSSPQRRSPAAIRPWWLKAWPCGESGRRGPRGRSPGGCCTDSTGRSGSSGTWTRSGPGKAAGTSERRISTRAHMAFRRPFLARRWSPPGGTGAPAPGPRSSGACGTSRAGTARLPLPGRTSWRPAGTSRSRKQAGAPSAVRSGCWPVRSPGHDGHRSRAQPTEQPDGSSGWLASICADEACRASLCQRPRALAATVSGRHLCPADARVQ